MLALVYHLLSGVPAVMVVFKQSSGEGAPTTSANPLVVNPNNADAPKIFFNINFIITS
jgi:hypothetical protein